MTMDSSVTLSVPETGMVVYSVKLIEMRESETLSDVQDSMQDSGRQLVAYQLEGTALDDVYAKKRAAQEAFWNAEQDVSQDPQGFGDRFALALDSHLAHVIYRALVGGTTGAAAGATVSSALIYGCSVFLFGLEKDQVTQLTLDAAGLGLVGGAVAGAINGADADSIQEAAIMGLQGGAFAGVSAAALIVLRQCIQYAKEDIRCANEMVMDEFNEARESIVRDFEDCLQSAEDHVSNQRRALKRDLDDTIQRAIKLGGDEGRRVILEAQRAFDVELNKVDRVFARNMNHANKLFNASMREAAREFEQTGGRLVQRAGQEFDTRATKMVRIAGNEAEARSKAIMSEARKVPQQAIDHSFKKTVNNALDILCPWRWKLW